jgi:site-specific recombinase XerD/ribosomal protein S27AE
MRIELLRKHLETGTIGKNRRQKAVRKLRSTEENRKLLLQFDTEQGINSRKECTRVNSMVLLSDFAEWLGEKPLRDVTKEDVRSFVENLKQRRNKNTVNGNLNERTVNGYKIKLRVFYKWLAGGEEYPECVAWLKPKRDHSILVPENILSEDEIRRIIEASENARDKALVAVLYESGARISEFLGVRLKNVAFDEYGALLSVSGKTGERRVRIVNSVPFLKEWISQNRITDQEAFVWGISTKYQLCRKGQPIGPAGVRLILKKLCRKAGIQKHVYPHLLRHCRATHLAKKIPESILRRQLGWVEDSAMPKVYVNLSSRDVDDSLLQSYYGVKIERIERLNDTLLPKTCGNCGERNTFERSYCNKCNFPLNPEDVKARERRLLELMTPAVVEKLIEQKVQQLLAERAAGR